MKTLFLAIYFLFNFLIVSAQELGFPMLRNYTPQEYDNVPQVFSVVQDKKGITYFGLNGVVMQYDGKNWITTPISNNSSIYSLAVDNNGLLYVGATGDFGYFKKDAQSKLVFESLHHLLPNKTFKHTSVWQTIILNDEVYFRTFEAVFRYSPFPNPKITVFEADKNKIFGGLVTDNQKMYLFCHQKGLFEIGKDSLQMAKQGEFFKDKELYSGFSYSKDTILIVTRHQGLYLYAPKSDEIPQPFCTKDQSYFDDNHIYFSKPLSNNLIALGSLRKGVFVFDKQGNTIHNINQATLLESNYIRNIYSGNNDYLWITMNKGFAKIDVNFDLSYWNKNTGIADIVETVYENEGKIYIGTHQTAYSIVDKQIKNIEGLTTGTVWTFLGFKIGDKNILLAGTATGIFEINNNKAQRINTNFVNTESANKFFQSKIDHRRVFSTSFTQFISLLYENGKWKDEGVWLNLKETIRGIAEADDGTIWLGTFRGGVIKVIPNYKDISKPKVVHLYKEKDGLPSLKDIMPFRFRNKILFGTDYGLYQYNETTDKFEKYCELGEQFCNGSTGVFNLIEAADGKIWILPQENKKADIGYLSPQKNGKYEWIYKPFRRIPHMLLRTLYVEPNGVAWIGGSEGVFRYNITKDVRNYDKKYNTVIRKIILDEDSIAYYGNDDSLANSGLQNIDYQYNTISFEFAAPSEDYENNVIYSHYLEGFDKHWSEWTKDNRKDYTNLKEGKYIFRLKAKNIYGNESEITTYAFSISPPYYRTTIAYFIYLLLTILGIWGIVKWNTQRLFTEKTKLERIVKERTEEILQQKEEILQQSDFLQVANADISQKNQELNQQKEEMQTQAENLRLANIEIQSTFEEIRVLNEIGQEITSVLDFKQLVSTIYEKVNALMPAESFGIGIYNQAGNCIDFDGIIEKEQVLPYHFESLTDTHSLAAYCFNNQKAVLLNDVIKEISHYTGSPIPNTNTGMLPQSLIYQPLMFGNKPIGVLTAQSFLPNAYTKRDAMLLATLASYIAIAFDNAKVYRIIKIKNEQITDSIHYAKTIQQAILPSKKLINSLFKDNFIIFYPKDIVSGDFYWLHHVQTSTQNLTFIAVVDCTGHGVPGALMSMIGNTLLNEIVIKKEIYEPKLILESLNDSIRVYLKQDENENHDGMDMSLCCITKHQENYEISYAGAKRPLFIVQNGILKELKGSRKSIGGIQDTNREFTQEDIVLTPNDFIYLCSDGFIDQNNKTRERFSTHRLTNLIRLYSNLSCSEQKELIEQAFHQFKGESLQRDDVTLIGIKF